MREVLMTPPAVKAEDLILAYGPVIALERGSVEGGSSSVAEDDVAGVDCTGRHAQRAQRPSISRTWFSGVNDSAEVISATTSSTRRSCRSATATSSTDPQSTQTRW